ncbi:MAG TPA: MFS transporter [Blastocatellia bacterium]|nr:MFS transporter [Blastocatellia bacterium]
MISQSAYSAAAKPAPVEARQRRLQTSAYFAAFVALGLTTGSLGPTLPGLAEQTRSRLNEISFLFMARSLGYLFGSFGGGRLFDKAPGNRVMAGALVVMAAMMATVPSMPLVWLLIVILLMLGAAEGALDVGGNTLLVWAHGERVGPFMNGLHFFFGVGAFISPVIVAQALLLGNNIALAYRALALLLLPVAVWLLRLPSPAPKSVSKDGPATRTDLRLVLLIALFFFLYVGAEIGFGGWVFTYALKLDLSGEKGAAYLTSAFWGSLTLGRLLAIPISSRLRPRSILLADLALCVASVTMILLRPDSVAVLWVCTLSIGLAMASIFPTTFSFAERRMTITGKVTGWFLVGASAGAMSVPWLIGQLFESIGPRVMMLTILLDLSLAVGIFTVLARHSARPIDYAN